MEVDGISRVPETVHDADRRERLLNASNVVHTGCSDAIEIGSLRVGGRKPPGPWRGVADASTKESNESLGFTSSGYG
jgi:hypothetical protein